MKTSLFLCVLAAAACGKSNDIPTLEHEANTVAAYYQPKLEALDKRVQLIFKRGTTIPANLPGIEEVGKRLTEARDTLVQLRGIVAPGPDGKSAVAKQAQAATKDRKANDLQKLIHDTETTLQNGITVINDDLSAVESWIGQYDQSKAAGPVAATATVPNVPSPEAPAPPTTPAPPPPATPAPAH